MRDVLVLLSDAATEADETYFPLHSALPSSLVVYPHLFLTPKSVFYLGVASEWFMLRAAHYKWTNTIQHSNCRETLSTMQYFCNYGSRRHMITNIISVPFLPLPSLKLSLSGKR